MRVRTFVGKVSIEGLRQMDEIINHWFETHEVEPKFITQTYGTEQHHEVSCEEPVVITSVFY